METSDYISVIALIVSLVTLWLTLLRKGTISMTRPSFIYIGPERGIDTSKIVIRAALFSTAAKGCVVESLWAILEKSDTKQVFDFWGYDDGSGLVRGGGLFVGESGVASYHHFVMPNNQGLYVLGAGQYTLKIYAQIVGKRQNRLLCSTPLSINESQAQKLTDTKMSVHFNWRPDLNQYEAHVDSRPNDKAGMEKFLQAMLTGH